MNIYSILGLLMAVGVLFSGFKLSSDRLDIFWDHIALLLVLGGTLAAASISFQINRLIFLVKVFIVRMIRGKKTDYADVVKNLMQIAEAYRRGESLDDIIRKSKDHFIKDGLAMWKEGILQGEEYENALNERAKSIYHHYSEDALKIKSLAKYPPAFGLMGTSMGMVVLLSNLAGKDAIQKVGPAMGICLTATLYGIALANLVLFPVGENLADAAKETNFKNKLIIEGIMLIREKANPLIVAEKLNSYLIPTDRLDWKKVVNK